MKEKLAKLIDVKTIVTFVVMAVLAVLSLKGVIFPDRFMDVAIMVISFYFGTQSKKNDTEVK